MGIFGESYSKFKGVEKIINGTFDTDSDWTKGAGWTITGGKAVATNVTGFALFKPVTWLADAGKAYTLEFTVSDYSGSGRLVVWIDGVFTANITANGNYSYVRTTTSTAGNLFEGADGLNCKLDNVSLTEVIDLKYGILKPVWTEPQIIRHESIINFKKNFIRVSGDLATFQIDLNIWKNASPAVVMAKILSFNHSTAKFMPYVSEDPEYLKDSGGVNEADFFIFSMIPYYVNNEPPMLEDRLMITFKSLKAILLPTLVRGFLVDGDGDYFVDGDGNKLIIKRGTAER